MKQLLLAIAAISTVVFPVRADLPLVNYFDIPDVVLSPGQSGTLKIEDGTFIPDDDTIDGIYFRFNGNVPFAYGANGIIYGTGSGFFIALNDSGIAARRHALGDSLNFEVAVAPALLRGAAWAGDDGSATAYLAFQGGDDLKEGWIAVKFNDAAHTLTLESLAFATAPFTVRAGETSAVPEPAETATLMALFAGSAAVWRRQRKQRASQVGGPGRFCAARPAQGGAL